MPDIPVQNRGAGVAVSLVALALALALLAACSTPAQRADRFAAEHGLQRVTVSFGYTLVTYFKPAPAARELWVFIDGDGSPWRDAGRHPADDPTPRNPLALRLAAATAGPVLYLGRPCYFAVRADARCDTSLWTQGRYGAPVIDSMAAALNDIARQRAARRIVLIGYSGGGALAVLMAPRIDALAAVVTIAGNLDTQRWTDAHGYLPLEQSLNPARQPPLPARIRQIHLRGMLDRNVDPQWMSGYPLDGERTEVWDYARFDHVCCWEAEWPAIEKRLRAALHPPPAAAIAASNGG